MFSIPEDEVTDEQRRQAKATNFGALFGSSPNGLVNYFSSSPSRSKGTFEQLACCISQHCPLASALQIYG